MRRWVLVGIHRDHDPLEFADSGHTPIVKRKVIRMGDSGD